MINKTGKPVLAVVKDAKKPKGSKKTATSFVRYASISSQIIWRGFGDRKF